MKIYIAGKITGLDTEEAARRFKASAHRVRAAGHEPVNPMEKVSEQEGKTWAEYMAEDFIIAHECDAIYMLSNWRDSTGARIEHAIAEIMGKPIFYEATAI